MNENPPVGDEPFGEYLRRARNATGLTLRAVQDRTTVTNGYLSQIEGGRIERPSPNVLHQLAEVYGLDYAELLRRAGHAVPSAAGTVRSAASRIPAEALDDLSSDEEQQLLDYLAFLKSKRRPSARGQA